MQPSPAVGVNRLTARRGLRALRRKTVPFAIHRASLPHRPLIRHGPLGCATFSPRRRRGVICHRLPFACPLAVIAPGLAGHAGPALRGNDTACHSSTPGGNRSRAGGAEPRPYIRSSFLPHFISVAGRRGGGPYEKTVPFSIVAGLRAIRESPLRYSCPFLRRAGPMCPALSRSGFPCLVPPPCSTAARMAGRR